MYTHMTNDVGAYCNNNRSLKINSRITKEVDNKCIWIKDLQNWISMSKHGSDD